MLELICSGFLSTGQLRNTLSRARELCERWRNGRETPSPPAAPDDDGGGRLARWFSVRRGSAHHYDMHTHDTDKMPKLPELEEDMFSCGGEVRGGRVPPPSLGPPPDALTAVQLRRRHVVAAIIHSENSYVATLQRLVNVSILVLSFYLHFCIGIKQSVICKNHTIFFVEIFFILKTQRTLFLISIEGSLIKLNTKVRRTSERLFHHRNNKN
ncbi:Rho guanine nucleotide exchange factor 10-like protein [Papilio machaon]|uniref:Rho guanine nucleotide exchange factor 10-like protein n=1 Tax=Papilio machaon TaxID=76193 RepID=A0A0N1IQV8_PAPMA|nr:Rho guanine nucleotide exchange factor 10-like protein [Papilio machaon]